MQYNMHYLEGVHICINTQYDSPTPLPILMTEYHDRMSLRITTISEKVSSMSMWITECFQLLFYSL